MSVGVPALPRGLDPLIAEAKERARRRWILLGLGAIVVIAAAAIGTTLGLGPGASPAARVVRSHGISVRLPRGWYVTRQELTNVSWPVQRFVVSSFPVKVDVSTRDGYLPPQTGVLAQIVEEAPPLSGEHWPPRPAHLRLRRLGLMKLFGGNRWDELLFRLHGRHFYAFVWIGRDAPAVDRQQLLTILDRMRVGGH